MADFLDEIAALTHRKVEGLKQQAPVSALKKNAEKAGPARGFHKALRLPSNMALIAELKQASPSAGLIRHEFDMEGRITRYDKGGAAALSILTEENFFNGSPMLLDRARRVTQLPLLRKDFLIDTYQIYESRGLGADAVLLIVALLPGSMLQDFLHHADDAHLDTLVEVHDERELDRALEAGAPLIGINNRDLHTLRVEPGTTDRLVPKIPKDRTIVIESGVKDPAQLCHYKSLGAHAVLIGEALMRSEDPESAVRAFVEAGKT